MTESPSKPGEDDDFGVILFPKEQISEDVRRPPPQDNREISPPRDFRLEDFCPENDWGQQKFSPATAVKTIIGKSNLKMTDTESAIYRYDGQIYRPDGERKIDLQICRTAGDRVRGRDVQEVIRRVKNELLEDPVDLDGNPYLLGIHNGVVDLRTGEFRDYQPDDLITYQLDVTYDPAARCPRFVKFLEEIQPNVTDRLTLVDWIPATAIRKPLPYVLFLLGLGRNGKGVYERVLTRFFGEEAFRDMSLSEVTRNNFAASAFYKTLGWIATEQSGKRKSTIGTDFIKLVTGAGVIDADRKNQSRIKFEAYFQTIVDTNAMPTIEDTSIGWMERFCKQDLPFVFVDDPDPDNPLEREKDPHLFGKLTTDEELSGILNLLIWRAKEISKTETITKRPAVELFAEYSKQSSSLSTFWDEFCEYEETAPGVRIPTSKIYQAYKRWCSHLVGEVVDEARFGRYLKKCCDGLPPTRRTVDGMKVTTYPGLIFDEDKLNSRIEAIERTREDKYGQVPDKKDSQEIDQQIAKGRVGQVKLWNSIVERFGQEVKENSLYMEESNELPVLPVLPVHSLSGDPKMENSTCPLPVLSMPSTCPPGEGGAGGAVMNEKSADRREDHFKTPCYLVLEDIPSFTGGGRTWNLSQHDLVFGLPWGLANHLLERGLLQKVEPEDSVFHEGVDGEPMLSVTA